MLKPAVPVRMQESVRPAVPEITEIIICKGSGLVPAGFDDQHVGWTVGSCLCHGDCN